jgi:hypothetical protein
MAIPTDGRDPDKSRITPGFSSARVLPLASFVQLLESPAKDEELERQAAIATEGYEMQVVVAVIALGVGRHAQ